MGRLKLGISLRPFRSNGNLGPAGFHSGVLAGLVVDYLAGVEDTVAVRNDKLDNAILEGGRMVERDRSDETSGPSLPEKRGRGSRSLTSLLPLCYHSFTWPTSKCCHSLRYQFDYFSLCFLWKIRQY